VSDDAFVRQVGGLLVYRCTEAIDPRGGFVFRTIGDAEGRCIEIAHSRNQMLLDRRLAIRVALAILEIAGEDEDLVTDHVHAGVVEITYDADGAPAGFIPYVSRTGTSLTDAETFTRRETRDDEEAPRNAG
jgi:hypothetical protein